MMKLIARMTATLSVGAVLSVWSSAFGPPAIAADLVFTPVPVPTTDASKRTIVASTAITLNGTPHTIGFKRLIRSGDVKDGGIFAALTDNRGAKLKDNTGAVRISPFVDFTTLFKTRFGLQSIAHVETRPAALYLSRLSQNTGTGALSVLGTAPINLASIGGLWVPCAGVMTAWGTHLGNEESPPEAPAFDAAIASGNSNRLFGDVKSFVDYFRVSATDLPAVDRVFKPYRYGYAFEARTTSATAATVVRHYAMGRFSHEVSYVMPDRRTVYMTDDGFNAGFYMFVADTAGDLSKGKLYAARWTQTDGSGAGAATIRWIDLGHADNATLEPAVATTKFADLFETAAMDVNEQCPTGFKAVNYYGGGMLQAGECLKVKPGKRVLASRFETRRYAAMLGATMEFNKAEGLTYDKNRRQLYVAMTSIDRGMGDRTDAGVASSKYDRGGLNHVKLGYNPCGAVYRLNLQADATIGSNFVATSVSAPTKLVGQWNSGVPQNVPNICHNDGLANPDNLTFIPEHDTLIIAEDTAVGHENAAVWAYDVGAETLTRIMTAPLGSEATSVYWYPNLGGFGYLMAVAQHPVLPPPNSDPKHWAAIVGTIGPFPVVP